MGRYGEKDFDFSAARITASVDESLKRLHVDYIDLIQCHDIEFCALDQIISEAIPARRDLQQTGKVRCVGISDLPLPVLHFVAQNSEIDTVLSYCHYTLNDTSLVKLIPYLKAARIGIINASALGMGLLTENEVPEWHPASTEIKVACARAAQYCRSKGVNIAKLALQFSASQPDIATTLVGIANPQQITANAQWLSETIDQELLAEVQNILAPIRDMTWPSGRQHSNAFQFTI